MPEFVLAAPTPGHEHYNIARFEGVPPARSQDSLPLRPDIDRLSGTAFIGFEKRARFVEGAAHGVKREASNCIIRNKALDPSVS